MAALAYAAITSLDGYIADADGDFSWARPDAEVFAFVNDLERGFGTYLYGRRMYETMRYWETASTGGATPEEIEFTALWRAADKVVYSRTLEGVATSRTRLERTFDAVAVRALKASATRDLSVAGAALAGEALAAGLVDDLHLVVTPVIVGGGTRALPDGVASRLALRGVDRFASGVVHLHYRVVA